VDCVQDLWSRTPRGRLARAGGFAAHVARRRALPDEAERSRLGHRSLIDHIDGFWDDGAPGAAFLDEADAVLLVGAPKHLVAAAVAGARRAGVPVAYQTVHRIDAAYVERRQYRRFAGEAHGLSLVVASHRRQADDVAEHLRYRGEVLVVPQWCYEDEAALLALAPPAADGPLRIGALCRFDRVKGLDVLVDAVTAAVGRGADCRLVLGGSGDEAEDLRRRGADLAAAGRLELAGHVRDRVAFLGGVDVAVVSSRAESGPIAGVEAMAAGRAIVSTPVGAMPERLEHGRSGLFFDVEDVDGLVGHLVELTADRALVQRLGEAARADYVERFRSELQEERLVGALADLAGRRRVSS
jgi:glycosyltransferase involved in cell wall biosynthesis